MLVVVPAPTISTKYQEGTEAVTMSFYPDFGEGVVHSSFNLEVSNRPIDETC